MHPLTTSVFQRRLLSSKSSYSSVQMISQKSIAAIQTNLPQNFTDFPFTCLAGNAELNRILPNEIPFRPSLQQEHRVHVCQRTDPNQCSSAERKCQISVADTKIPSSALTLLYGAGQAQWNKIHLSIKVITKPFTVPQSQSRSKNSLLSAPKSSRLEPKRWNVN